jgi:hypothetical protein
MELWRLFDNAESEVRNLTKNRQVSIQNFKQIPDWFLPFIDYLFDKPTLKFWETAFKQGKNIDELLKLYNQNTVYREKELYNRSRKSASYFAPKNKK